MSRYSALKSIYNIKKFSYKFVITRIFFHLFLRMLGVETSLCHSAAFGLSF
jgi:hypothetical protein